MSPRWVLALAAITTFLLPPLPANAQQQQNPVASLFNVRIGGYVQTNVTWDTDENQDDNPSALRQFAVIPGSELEDRETLRWAATRTRLFIDVRGPETLGARTRAYTEFDWDGLKRRENDGDASATAAHTPRLRHAYARLDWPAAYLTVGQTTLLFNSAVGSASEVESVSSAHGDITAGSRNRAPQFILGTVVPVGPAKMEVAGGVSRHATDRQAAAGINDSGSRSSLPAFLGLVKASVPVFGRDAIVAVSGYWGEETLTEASAFRDVNSQGVALEALVPIPIPFPGMALDIRGAGFLAENMARWNLGNAGGGLTTDDPTGNPREIPSKGFWVEANLDLPANFAIGLGRGYVQDKRSKVRAIGGTGVEPLDNTGWWGFAQWTAGPLLVELLYGRIDTTYIVPDTGDEDKTHSDAVHMVVRYRF
jgi:hypothetical protein